MNKSTIFLITSVCMFCWYSGVDTLLEPLSNVLTCPGKRIVFFCNVTTRRLTWMWQNVSRRGMQDYAAIKGVMVNKTVDLNGVPGVTTTLINFGFNGTDYVTSSLQFTPTDEFSSANITCNENQRTVKVTDCSRIIENFHISKIFNSANYSIFDLEWDVIRNDEITITVKTMDKRPSVFEIWTNDTFINLTLQRIKTYSIIFETIGCDNMCLIANVTISISTCDSYTFIISQIFLASNEDILQESYNCTNDIRNNEIAEGKCMQFDFWRSEIKCTQDKYCEPLLSELLNLRISGNIDSNNISYTCMEGFQPTEEVIAFCNSSSGHWNPNPRNHNCMEIPPSTKVKSMDFHPSKKSVWSIEVVGGSISVVIVVLFAIIIILTGSIFYRNKKRGKHVVRETDDQQGEMEYDRIQYHNTAQDNEVESSEYSILNTMGTSRCVKHNSLQPSDEDYSTINQPIIRNNLVRDDYDYTSINYSDANKGKALYAVLEKDTNCESLTGEDHINASSISITVNYSAIKQRHPADSLLNLDTLIIQLREISSKWESLGEHLNFSASILLQIKNIANGSDFNCLVELCDKWLRDVYNPTWKMVADVLILIGEEKLSSELLHIYDTGELPDRRTKQNSISDILNDEDAPPVPPQCF